MRKTVLAVMGNPIIVLLMLCLASTHAFSGSLPKQGASVIRQVNQAAKAADYARLQSLMATDFIWSFGGDADAAQAIAQWKTDPTALNQLIMVTQQPCVLNADSTMECPSSAGIGYRAGFKKTRAGWRMFYFVQGD